jgi:mannose-6-phosphate isomerase-like protein (cupin superfamily)
MKLSIDEILTKLPLPATEKWKDGVWDVELFEKNGVKLVFFAPRGRDYQTHHDEDEFYFIARGTATLVTEDLSRECVVGDVLFVAAKEAHHFEDMSDDFATWAIFF